MKANRKKCISYCPQFNDCACWRNTRGTSEIVQPDYFLKKCGWFFFFRFFFFSTGCRKGTGLDYYSHPWGNCLYSWIKPHPPEEQSCIRLLQDKSLSQGQPPFLTLWIASENPSRATMQTLSLEVGGWRGLRKRLHMGNCLPWVLIGTAQDEAADAARFQYDPPVT